MTGTNLQTTMQTDWRASAASRKATNLSAIWDRSNKATFRTAEVWGEIVTIEASGFVSRLTSWGSTATFSIPISRRLYERPVARKDSGSGSGLSSSEWLTTPQNGKRTRKTRTSGFARFVDGSSRHGQAQHRSLSLPKTRRDEAHG